MRMAGPGAKLLKPGEQLLNEGASLAHAYAAQINNRILRRILQKTDDFIHRRRSFMTAETRLRRAPPRKRRADQAGSTDTVVCKDSR